MHRTSSLIWSSAAHHRLPVQVLSRSRSKELTTLPFHPFYTRVSWGKSCSLFQGPNFIPSNIKIGCRAQGNSDECLVHKITDATISTSDFSIQFWSLMTEVVTCQKKFNIDTAKLLILKPGAPHPPCSTLPEYCGDDLCSCTTNLTVSIRNFWERTTMGNVNSRDQHDTVALVFWCRLIMLTICDVPVPFSSSFFFYLFGTI